MECPGEIEVLGWMQGGLPPEVLDRLDTHIDQCADCLAAVAALGRARATAPAGDAGRYVVGDELARGGMGQVFVATDRVLGREVALKTARDPAGAARFAREMRVTARLQHPAIVPVYDAGAFPDGEPFYVMRHVEGRTLDRAAAEARTLAERIALVPAVMTAVDAVAYAHDCGVVHRDLKPANVLIGRFGETVVLDWGLAKVIAEADDDAPGRADPAPVEAALTHAGAVLGTPAYMAPEQAAGEPTDARGDVYGLGAILYHVLTGAPPRRVVTEPVPPIATREPGVPAELAAIVDRAMAAEPADRYASARDLADDLRRYLAGRLVEAHRYTTAALVRRWAARHRAVLTVAGLALVAMVVLAEVQIRRVVDARDEARAQRTLAVASRQTSDTHRAAAERLVSLVLDDLRTRLTAMGRLDALVDVGRAVDDYYGRIPVREGADGAEDLIRRADALATLGDARLALGDLDGADAAFGREDELATEARTRRADAYTADAACRARLRRGDIAQLRGDLAAARRAYVACAEAATAAVAAAEPRLADLAIQVRVALADLDRVEGAFDDARPRLAEATAMAEAMARAEGERGRRGRELVVDVTNAVGSIAIDRGDIAGARAAFGANLERAEAAVAEVPGDADAQHALATALISVARVARRADDAPAAAAALGRSRELAQKLVDRDPDNVSWLRDLGIVESQLGSVELDRGDLDRAIGYLTAAHAIDLRLVRRNPNNVDWARDASVGAMQLGDLLRGRGRFAEARASLEESVTTCERLAAAQPTNAESQRDLAISLLHLGDLDRERKRGDAAATLARAVAIFRAQVEHGAPRSRTDLVSALLALSDAQAGTAARDSVAEARAVLAPLRASATADDAELTQAIADVDQAWAALQRR